MKNCDLVIIGGGPAGLAAAVAAHDAGVKDLVILEREPTLGGILNQCIHNGFGLHTFKEELTGPEYAARFEQMAYDRNLNYKLGSTVINVTKDRVVTYVSEEEGLQKISAKAVILTCGCRERPRGAINIPGARAAGIFSAGTAQKLVNIQGLMPGKEVVILGSGDIGLIMARRMTFEGAKVKAVVELMPYSSGLNRNIVQCLNDFNIPLKFSHTVVDIKATDGRVSSVVIAQVDDKLRPIMETAEEIACDTLLLSVGLLPENELASYADVEISPITNGAIVDDRMMTSVEGIFECGNVLHVHDLVDYVSEESAHAGRCAASYILSQNSKVTGYVPTVGTNGVRYVVPQKIAKNDSVEPISLRMRVGNVYKNVEIAVLLDGEKVASRKKQIVTPGEMETIVLNSEIVAKVKIGKQLEVTLNVGGTK
ncbi:MAG: FAD-dependent oxidoreductase [Clostridiales bacterium]|nr:FAD-dependent oxidoreductase [Clostridiales bacterium]